ncbi:adhesion G protein-coupled receptor G3-like [Salarias fasciatus]|uniref:Adhesion G protein-coupled receptor G3-like n=1 Tax=Salarias fasciatus TaxID=181472 RepID=A0A672IBV5_SALFA|nr:adhesion G protein-coupled receptor G3-like [Salarias fasciatus]
MTSNTMWIARLLAALLCFSTSWAGNCQHVLDNCYSSTNTSWIQCYESRILRCSTGRLDIPGFKKKRVSSSVEAEAIPTPEHRVNIPSSALQRSSGSSEEVVLVATVINSTYFQLSPPRKSRAFPRPAPLPGSVLGGLVLAVKVGGRPLRDLSERVNLTFKHNSSGEIGTCVFWDASQDGTGQWNTEGCLTADTGSHYICSCNHLSFFAVLVNPKISLDRETVVTLSYITYVGSSLSAALTTISLIIYICFHGRRPEKSIGVHMQLTGALLSLHLSFLLCSLWSRLQGRSLDGWVCSGLGFFLHWSLLAALSWSVLEGFHLYLLLIRVFNIYVRRYMLKLSLVGWGFPTVVAAVCAASGVYGTYRVNVTDTTSHVSEAPEAQICWLNSDFPHMLPVAYSTVVVFPCLVVLYNTCMLVLVVLKLWKLRMGGRGFERGSDWRKMCRERGRQVWKDCATVLGLSCVLGLPWGLAVTTHISTAGLYIFTVLNSLQGVFVFLWSLALTCKSRSENNSSSKYPSSQKVMTTSFNS